MHTTVTSLPGRAHVLAATGHHPYALLSTGGTDEVRGYRADGVTAWRTAGGRGPAIAALGDGPAAARLLRALADTGELAGVARAHLPRVSYRDLAGQLPVGKPDHWDFRWSTEAPPRQPGQERVVRLAADDEPAVAALLARAFPASFARAGDPRVRAWYGVRHGDELIACGADRSRGGVGSIAGVAVHPQWRGRGLGAALTATVAGRLHREFDVVTLGVMTDNLAAIRLYHRLGFTRVTERTSVDLPAEPAPGGAGP